MVKSKTPTFPINTLEPTVAVLLNLSYNTLLSVYNLVYSEYSI